MSAVALQKATAALVGGGSSRGRPPLEGFSVRHVGRGAAGCTDQNRSWVLGLGSVRREYDDHGGLGERGGGLEARRLLVQRERVRQVGPAQFSGMGQGAAHGWRAIARGAREA